MSYSTLMDKLVDFEHELAELYLWFSNGFRHDQDASRVFGRLSMQKEKHVNLIRYQKRLANGNTSSFFPLDSNLDEIDRIFEVINEFRGQAQPTLSEAIKLSIKLEGSAAKNLHRSAVTNSNSDIASFIAQLAGDDRKNLEMLESLAARSTSKAS
jgi:rubrerythrin